jgi:hypothetical protein
MYFLKSVGDSFSLGERYHGGAILHAAATDLGVLQRVTAYANTTSGVVGANPLRAAAEIMGLSLVKKFLFWLLAIVTCGIYYAASLSAVRKKAEDRENPMGVAMIALKQLAESLKEGGGGAKDSKEKKLQQPGLRAQPEQLNGNGDNLDKKKKTSTPPSATAPTADPLPQIPASQTPQGLPSASGQLPPANPAAAGQNSLQLLSPPNPTADSVPPKVTELPSVVDMAGKPPAAQKTAIEQFITAKHTDEIQLQAAIM